MEGGNQLYAAEGEFAGAAQIGRDRLQSLGGKYGRSQLYRAADPGTGSPGDLHCIADVVAVPMGHTDVVGLHFVRLYRSQWIFRQVGIGQHAAVPVIQQKTGVS